MRIPSVVLTSVYLLFVCACAQTPRTSDPMPNNGHQSELSSLIGEELSKGVDPSMVDIAKDMCRKLLSDDFYLHSSLGELIKGAGPKPPFKKFTISKSQFLADGSGYTVALTDVFGRTFFVEYVGEDSYYITMSVP